MPWLHPFAVRAVQRDEQWHSHSLFCHWQLNLFVHMWVPLHSASQHFLEIHSHPARPRNASIQVIHFRISHTPRPNTLHAVRITCKKAFFMLILYIPLAVSCSSRYTWLDLIVLFFSRHFCAAIMHITQWMPLWVAHNLISDAFERWKCRLDLASHFSEVGVRERLWIVALLCKLFVKNGEMRII